MLLLPPARTAKHDSIIPRIRGVTKAGEHFNIPENTPTSAGTAPLLVDVRENGQKTTLKRRKDKGDDGNPRDKPLAKSGKHMA